MGEALGAQEAIEHGEGKEGFIHSKEHEEAERAQTHKSACGKGQQCNQLKD
jgi:hypothetical protein